MPLVERAVARDVHEAGRCFVAEAARAEVTRDPQHAAFVFEDVHVVVAAADGAKLLARERQQPALRRDG